MLNARSRSLDSHIHIRPDDNIRPNSDANVTIEPAIPRPRPRKTKPAPGSTPDQLDAFPRRSGAVHQRVAQLRRLERKKVTEPEEDEDELLLKPGDTLRHSGGF